MRVLIFATVDLASRPIVKEIKKKDRMVKAEMYKKCTSKFLTVK